MCCDIREKRINEIYDDLLQVFDEKQVAIDNLVNEIISSLVKHDDQDDDFWLHDSYSIDWFNISSKPEPVYRSPIPNNFCKNFFKLATIKNIDVVTCCRKAWISSRGVQKVLEGTFDPSKDVVLSLAFAMELDFEQTKQLTRAATFHFDDKNPFDCAMEFFIKSGIYDVYIVNRVLLKFNQPMLGYYYI